MAAIGRPAQASVEANAAAAAPPLTATLRPPTPLLVAASVAAQLRPLARAQAAVAVVNELPVQPRPPVATPRARVAAEAVPAKVAAPPVGRLHRGPEDEGASTAGVPLPPARIGLAGAPVGPVAGNAGAAKVVRPNHAADERPRAEGAYATGRVPAVEGRPIQAKTRVARTATAQTEGLILPAVP